MVRETKPFKWFGEGFEGFPKDSPEACITYSLFLIHNAKDARPRTTLEPVDSLAIELLNRYGNGYLWQREEFNLVLGEKGGRPTLCGNTDFGDSIEDEWFIVFLLRELSKAVPDLWIQVRDSDGEFLLIEAANALPNWLNPEVADNRVWIHEGNIFIIPISKGGDRNLTIEDALAILESGPDDLLQSDALQKEAFFRVNKYPDQIQDNFHRASILIPRLLAGFLHENPRLVTKAVEAFYLREPESMKIFKHSQDMKAAGQHAERFALDDLVDVSIKFTKVGFARLKSEDFPPPADWEAVISQKDSLPGKESRIEIGMKLTCAFEIALSDSQLAADSKLGILKASLGTGTPDSKFVPSDESMKSWDQTDDSENWLDIDFEDFDADLSGKNLRGDGKEASKGSGYGHQAAEENLRKMVSRFTQFLNDDSAGMEGAELADEMDYDDDEDSTLESDGEEQSGSFDEAEFAKMMREMMGLPPEEQETGKKDKGVLEVNHSSSGSEADDPAEIRKLMQQMEAELEEAGALDLNPTPHRLATLRDTRFKSSSNEQSQPQEAEEDSVDVNLVRNMLESLKAEGGMAGPSGNMLNVLGLQMPRDEDDVRKPSTSKK